MIVLSVSESKKALIDSFLKTPLKVGEEIYVDVKAIGSTSSIDKLCTISSVDPLKVKFDRYGRDKETAKINLTDIKERRTHSIGANPFCEDTSNIRSYSYGLCSIMSKLKLDEDSDKKLHEINGIEVQNVSFNPYIYMKDGSKEYYQRPFVWTIEDKQMFIESIYNRMDCGKVLIREYDFPELRKKSRQRRDRASLPRYYRRQTKNRCYC